MTPGIRVCQRLATAVVKTADTALSDVTGFTFPVKAGKSYHFRIVLPFSVAATGGFKFLFDIPAAPTNYVNAQEVNDGVTATPGAQIVSVVTAAGNFANAFASVAGNHLLTMEGDLIPSVAGNMKLQVACNSAAGVLTALPGAYMEVVSF